MSTATDHIDKKLREQTAATGCPLTVAQIETAADENGRWDGSVWTFSEQGLILAVQQAIRMLPASLNEAVALIADILAQDDKLCRALGLAKIESRSDSAHQDWKAMQKTWDNLMNRARSMIVAPGAAIDAREQDGDWLSLMCDLDAMCTLARTHGITGKKDDEAAAEAKKREVAKKWAASREEVGLTGQLATALEAIEAHHDPFCMSVLRGKACDCGMASREEAPAASAVPEGCTPADARMLRSANHGLAAENDRLREALQFYADGNHFTMHDANAWDTVSGEPANFYEDEANTATVEDGSAAKMALANNSTPSEALSPATVAQPVADGWQLVPVQPTSEMLDAGSDAGDGHDWSGADPVYRAMLQAAPVQPCASQGCAVAESVKCKTCNDNGMIGGPSFSEPGEGGVPCPDCSSAQPSRQQGAEAVRLLEVMRWHVNRNTGRIDHEFVLRLIELAKDEAEGLAAGPFTQVVREDADRFCQILRALGMEEDGDPVAEVQRLLDLADKHFNGKKE